MNWVYNSLTGKSLEVRSTVALNFLIVFVDIIFHSITSLSELLYLVGHPVLEITISFL